ncbi:killer cell lectin-like receptor subfamily B member 1B allele C isoform X1 [Aquila chrysaetos chrysaetos]|uniref:Killer cell lectin-like receptor subfamily B member 1B allele C n=1 Tax=Aquila chrysaetos chrysaetos TaxID=223781 RepID=A0A663F7E9_AQUCH|nr:killer cell lectin-like receptor subfamily B member 1B allele C isoform X1 [Aquila chrysaetos chrysaetos]
MAGEIIYADLRHPGDGFSPAEKRHAPALCPRWHGVVLKVSGLGHLVLLVLVVVLSVQVFQGSLQPVMTSIPWQGSETRGKNHTEQCVISALMQYYCKPRQDSPTACAGCKLCPQDWQLHGDRCYRLSKETGNWNQGKKGCENQGSQLAMLRDKKEEEYIKNITGGRTQPVWIGLLSSHRNWRWVDNTSLNTKMFRTLQEVDEGCGTLKNKMLEVDICDAEHEWLCQKHPFQLSPSTAGGGKKCEASV